MLDRRSSGVRERHQRPVTKAHKTEDDRERDAAQCDSGAVRAHGSYVVTVRWVASPAPTDATLHEGNLTKFPSRPPRRVGHSGSPKSPGRRPGPSAVCSPPLFLLLALSGPRGMSAGMSAIGGKADMPVGSGKCPLMTQSGHRLPQRASLKSISLRDNCPSKLFLCTWSFRLSPPR